MVDRYLVYESIPEALVTVVSWYDPNKSICDVKAAPRALISTFIGNASIKGERMPKICLSLQDMPNAVDR